MQHTHRRQSAHHCLRLEHKSSGGLHDHGPVFAATIPAPDRHHWAIQVQGPRGLQETEVGSRCYGHALGQHWPRPEPRQQRLTHQLLGHKSGKGSQPSLELPFLRPGCPVIHGSYSVGTTRQKPQDVLQQQHIQRKQEVAVPKGVFPHKQTHVHSRKHTMRKSCTRKDIRLHSSARTVLKSKRNSRSATPLLHTPESHASAVTASHSAARGHAHGASTGTYIHPNTKHTAQHPNPPTDSWVAAATLFPRALPLLLPAVSPMLRRKHTPSQQQQQGQQHGHAPAC
jgi:hypothetical protein